jgi:hypothetical protein
LFDAIGAAAELGSPYETDGAVVPWPAASPDGFTGEPTLGGVAPGVEWKGLLFQNARLGVFHWPPL